MLLRRQLRRLGLSPDAPPDAVGWRAFLAAVTGAYDDANQDRYTLERSLLISSREMRELHDEAQQAADNFETVVERSLDPTFVYTDDKIVRFANPTMLRMLRYDGDPGGIVGRPLFEIVHAEDRAALEAFQRAWPHGGGGWSPRVRLLRRDGGVLHAEGNRTEIAYRGARAILVMARDVGERVAQEAERARMAEQLRLSEERYRLLFEKIPLSVLLFDVETLRILAANEAASRLYGYDEREILALGLSDLKASGVEELVERMGEVRAKQRAGETSHDWKATRRHRRKDGSVVDVDITSHTVSVDGRPAQLAIGVDVTERLRLEERLRHAQKMDAIGQLAGGVAHDFNNILAVILADAEEIRDGLPHNHPLRTDAEEVVKSALRAAALTRQLLAFSRQQLMQPRVVDLNGLVGELQRMLLRVLGSDVVLEVALDPGAESVLADPGQLEQVVLNLVVNARDAMPRGGRLRLATRRETLDSPSADRLGQPAGDYMVLSVSDTGCGMDEATLARIFEPFFTTKSVGQGTGLGLATVFGIVQQSHGFVDVTSRVGHGSRFDVYLPGVAGAEDTPRAQTTRPDALEGGHVIVVEDDPQVRRVTRRVLEGRGYRVSTADSGEHGLEVLAAHAAPVDLLITDLIMPGIDGASFAARARECRPDLKVLYMSGHASHEVMRTVHAAGAPLLMKPFTPHALAAAVRAAIAR